MGDFELVQQVLILKQFAICHACCHISMATEKK